MAHPQGSSQWSPDEYLDVSSQALRLWDATTNDEKARFAHKMFLVHFRRAEMKASDGNFTDAKAELLAEAEIQRIFGGRLEYATKSSNSFFERLAKLHATVTAATGGNPLTGMVGYLFHQQGDQFIVARLELDPEVKGIPIDLEESEALTLVLQVTVRDGQAMIETTRWIVGPKGTVEQTLRRATREVSLDAEGRLIVQELSAAVFPPAPKRAEVAPILTATPVPIAPTPTAPPEHLESAAHAPVSRDFRPAASIWESISSQNSSTQEAQLAFNEMLAAWERLPQNHKKVEYSRLALAYIRQSEVELASKRANEAASKLKTAGLLNQQFGRRIDYTTKTPDSFFERLAKLQAGIAQMTGKDPLSGMTEYL